MNRGMFKKILVGVLLTGLIAGAAFYSRQGEFYNPFNGTGEVKTVYTESKEVNLPMEKVRTLNPVTSKDRDTYHISKLIFESLFYLDDRLALNNGLVSSYSYSADKMSVTMNLKNDSYFSNGINLTGSDVKYSIESYIQAASYGSTIYGSYVSNIKSVSVDRNDKYSVTVKFKDKRDVSMENFIFPIVSEKSYGNAQAGRTNRTDFIPIGSGAYAVESYNDISELVLTANTYYSGTKPENSLVFTVLPEQESVIPLLEVNNISIGFFESLYRDTLVSDKNITATNFISNELDVIGYNFNKAAMSDRKVRQAIAYATDIETLNESAYYKNGVLCDTIYFPGYLGVQNTGDNYSYDIEKASKLLASAGYADRDENGYLEDADENELSIEILVNGSDQSRVTVAESVKSSLDKLSVISRIVYAENTAEFNAKLGAGQYDIFIGGMKINETYDLRALLHSNYYNTLGYSNKELDLLLDELKSGVSNEKKAEIVSDAKKILIKELPYYCITYKTYGALAAGCLNGNSNTSQFNNIYNGCEEWFCKYELSQAPEVVDSAVPKEEAEQDE